jgi:hypothetical protein
MSARVENPGGSRLSELRQILEALFEDRASPAQLQELNALVLGDAACRRFYLEYVELHGNLYWDAAQAAGVPAAATILADPEELEWHPRLVNQRRKRWSWPALTAVAAVVLAAMALWIMVPVRRPAPRANGNLAVEAKDAVKEEQTVRREEAAPALPPQLPKGQRPDQPELVEVDRADVRAPADNSSQPPAAQPALPKNASVAPATPAELERTPKEEQQPKEKEIVAFVNGQLRKAWKSAGLAPSPRASDSEWLRRVYLDIVGHIPPEDVVDAFLVADGKAKRAELVDKLLQQPDYARNWATIWTNLLVGRQPRTPGVSREMLEKFLRDSFSSNVPWNEVVYELVSAEGTPEQNPATNFLLAHLNNDAVPATAMTARLFLGIQVQCTQCHDHPFQSDKQNHFWELKSFFQQTEMAPKQGSAVMGAAGASDQPAALPELVSRKVGGPLYYETRRGEMRVAYPVYAGHKIDPGPSVNRRRELARLIAKEDDRQVALSVVNRAWQHFFGYGFTRPVDDMGPHNPPSNPEVLDRLTDEYITSGYDMKQLCRWICTSDAYQRTGVLRLKNRSDDPSTGAQAAFSGVYLKPMTAEQLYDSLLVATRAKSSARTDWNDAGRRRQDWVRQFVINYGTDENDEATVPSGSISEALLMMNDSIVHTALAAEPGTFLYDVAHDRVDDAAKIRRLCRSALSRDPKPAELSLALEQLQSESEAATSEKSRDVAEARALQDIFWAFLNANEFAFVH